MSAARIYADFHNLDDCNRLRLTCMGTRDDLARHGIELQEGLRLTFYMDDANDNGEPDDLLADGVTHYDAEEHCWVAAVDWPTLRHASQDGSRSIEPDRGVGPRLEGAENYKSGHAWKGDSQMGKQFNKLLLPLDSQAKAKVDLALIEFRKLYENMTGEDRLVLKKWIVAILPYARTPPVGSLQGILNVELKYDVGADTFRSVGVPVLAIKNAIEHWERDEAYSPVTIDELGL
jgi:hypothetical protein